jgi:hypothetical protein
MSVHSARALIGDCKSMEGGEPPRFSIEVNVPIGGQKLAVLQLYHGATLQMAVEGTVDLHWKTVCFNKLIADVYVV